MNLTGVVLGQPFTPPDHEELAELARYYNVELENDNGTSYRREVFDLVPRVLERCLDVQRDGKIDFNDMIWLPVVLNLPVCRYDLLLVDEAQDLNRCQQELAKKAGARLIFCGDDRQAIYGFAGADSESMNRLQTDLTLTSVGCVELPLTVTRRCGKAIVADAQKIVPDFSAHESNGEGTISYMSFSEEYSQSNPCYRTSIRAGDMALCRVNAPLVSQCFKFIREGRKATIQGRDIAQGLITTVNKMRASSVEHLIEKLEDWAQKEIARESVKRNPNEDKIIAVQDRLDCLICFTEGSTTIQDVIRRIEAIFTDDKHAPGIRLSSIHKAKGLEAKRVFFLRPEGAGCPHPMARTPWQQAQEQNLCYVAVTRAIEELVYVS
jgi:superfamily I DNA/RNA helicase